MAVAQHPPRMARSGASRMRRETIACTKTDRVETAGRRPSLRQIVASLTLVSCQTGLSLPGNTPGASAERAFPTFLETMRGLLNGW
jgi:hypothetical protein